MFLYFHKYIFIILLFIFICFNGLVFSLNTVENTNQLEADNSKLIFSNNDFIWPTPGYKTITSNYGYRQAPTSGAGAYHAGIDIGATTGSKILAAFSGKVTYIGFYGANGYTIKITNGTSTANYSHVSQYFLVYVGQVVDKGEVIATVGPKNVYDVPYNKFKDSNGNPTNGATTGPHLHFSLYIDGKSINPLYYLPY